MSEILKCPSCGGSNQLPEGKTSMFCAFCGNPIEKTQVYQNEDINPIKSKPEITNPAVHSKQGIYYSPKEYFRERVSGGWQVHDELLGTRFIPDEQYEVGGYELRLSKRGISTLDQVITWFTDSELETIKYLDLSNNKITDISGIERFRSAQIINLSNNKIKLLPHLGNFDQLQVLDLSGNEIEKLEGLYSNNFKINDSSNYGEYRGKDIYRNVLIFLNNNKISKISDEIINNLKNLLLLNRRINLEIKDNPIISTPEIRKFQKLNSTLTAKELAKSQDHWITTVSEYLTKSFSKERFSTPDIHRKSFLKWIQEFEVEQQNKPKNHSRIIIDLKHDKTEYKYEKYELSYPSIDKVKSALRQRTGYNPDDVKPGYCFIATAAMGSYNNPQVLELRSFRDEWILKKSWGESFVNWYYHYGAIAADFIEKSFVLKRLSHLFIVKPLVYLSRMVNSSYSKPKKNR